MDRYVRCIVLNIVARESVRVPIADPFFVNRRIMCIVKSSRFAFMTTTLEHEVCSISSYSVVVSNSIDS